MVYLVFNELVPICLYQINDLSCQRHDTFGVFCACQNFVYKIMRSIVSLNVCMFFLQFRAVINCFCIARRNRSRLDFKPSVWELFRDMAMCMTLCFSRNSFLDQPFRAFLLCIVLGWKHPQNDWSRYVYFYGLSWLLGFPFYMEFEHVANWHNLVKSCWNYTGYLNYFYFV